MAKIRKKAIFEIKIYLFNITATNKALFSRNSMEKSVSTKSQFYFQKNSPQEQTEVFTSTLSSSYMYQ